MKVKSTTLQASDAPPEYRDLLILMREIQVTANAIASFITTRSQADSTTHEFIRMRLDYIEGKLEAANEEISV